MVTLFMINPLNSIGFRMRHKKSRHFVTESLYTVIVELLTNRKMKVMGLALNE